MYIRDPIGEISFMFPFFKFLSLQVPPSYSLLALISKGITQH